MISPATAIANRGVAGTVFDTSSDRAVLCYPQEQFFDLGLMPAGVTLNSAGTQIGNKHVTVFAGGSATVTLNRGADQVTYACASSRCEPAPVPGDGKDIFDSAVDQITKHQDLGAKAADAR